MHVLHEILDDYAATLLHDARATRTAGDRARHALELLDEADRLVERGEYGWYPARLNRATALRRLGDLPAVPSTM